MYEITTERLAFRRCHPDDFEAVMDIYSRPEVARRVASWPIPADPDLVRERCNPFPDEKGIVGSVLKDDRVIGTIGCARKPEGDFGLGYGFHPDHWGRGYATEMAFAVLDRIFGRADCTLVTAGHYIDNPASGRVLAKLRFRHSHTELCLSKGRGHKADCAEYTLARSDWLEFRTQVTYRQAASAAKDMR